MSSRPSFFRRKFIVDRRFQLELLFRAGFYSVAMFIVLGAGVFYPMIREIESSEDSPEAVNAMLYMHQHFWPVALLCIVLAMFLSVHTSHRIAGPLYQIKRAFKMLQRGAIPAPVGTRRRDYLKEEVAMLNDATESIGTAVARIQMISGDLANTVALCNDLAVSTTDTQLRYALTEARAQSEALAQAVSHFRSGCAPRSEVVAAAKPEPEVEPV